MLLKNSGETESWTSYAASCFLAGDFDSCIGALESVARFEEQQKK